MTANQTRTIRHLTINGRTVPLVQAARAAKLDAVRVRGRLRNGWTDEEAIGLLPPPRIRRPSKPGAGRKQRDLPFITDGSEEQQRQLRISGDLRFQEAMWKAGYLNSTHTAPCTENPIFINPQVLHRSPRNFWDAF